MRRRRFLQGALAGLGAWLGRPVLAPGARAAPQEGSGPDGWEVLEAALDRLLPADGDGPGARDIGAADYLRTTLNGPRIDPEDRDFLLQGADWLDDAARKEAGAPFPDLPPVKQDAVLTTIARSDAGDRWLARLLDHLFEALLADPIYGGNAGGRGWAWLEHRPGFPRPPASKTYPRLAERWYA
ncbi:gluconate 2-dehydrogenase subunit 3 family protein [Thiohalorhabdus denitrificans]|uniref:Gluconate 2-dehydrogenase gamma chain n=1 Tax=Thiohalorhabdus denitrificans TaxID=381306 RepID=A0A1G5G367_9GAMM|nr:gluconate 2-dehydrogenase subunit 3 family protein [Thiohalorhabdus denitrificans]SCY46036.1 gluconate 2-dehydrogenase gamma chain [Thiohalorhabdus denitrificans]